MTDVNNLAAHDIREVLKAIGDEKLNLAQAAGEAVTVELKMRFLAQISEDLRQELPQVSDKLNKLRKSKTNDDNFLNLLSQICN